MVTPAKSLPELEVLIGGMKIDEKDSEGKEFLSQDLTDVGTKIMERKRLSIFD